MPLPLSVVGFYAFGELDLKLIVTIPASCFIALGLGAMLNKPEVKNVRLPRI